MIAGRLVCGLSEDDFERVREAASAAVRTHIANRAEAVEVRPVPDGGYSGSIENGRLSKTGDTPAAVRKALADALQAEEEEEVTVQRLNLTGLALLASTCLDSEEGTDAPQPSSNEEKLRERLEEEIKNLDNIYFLADQESLTLGADGNHFGEFEAKGIAITARNARDRLRNLLAALREETP